MNAMPDRSKHPCFNEEAKGVCGRVHLPVAPKCNIKCNYCDRKFDCVNESRPGVSSTILSPEQAGLYMKKVMAKQPDISVVGIAGPGDPLANPDETFRTLKVIRDLYPEMIFCLSTNGLKLPENLDNLKKLGVSHVTVTVNAVDPAIGEKVYSWARDGKIIYRGREAAELLLKRQLEGIKGLKERGIIAKVNTILIPGVNEDHVEEVAKKMAEMGVDVLNVMAMVQNPGTPFGELEEPSQDKMHAARKSAEKFLPQMKHCQRCRADAVGLLEEDRSHEFADDMSACANTIILRTDKRPYVAVATREGVLVNQHLGEASSFQIWKKEGGSYSLFETRTAPDKGTGNERWVNLAETLNDCRAVLVSGFGKTPEAVLLTEGLPVIEMSGFIEMGLKALYDGGDIGVMHRRRPASCSKGAGCGGDGGGCG